MNLILTNFNCINALRGMKFHIDQEDELKTVKMVINTLLEVNENLKRQAEEEAKKQDDNVVQLEVQNEADTDQQG